MKKIILVVLGIGLIACKGKTKEETTEQSPPKVVVPQVNAAKALIEEMAAKTGTYGQLQALNNVVYTYTYRTPDGKEDISIEQYGFKGELSYGKYSKHERTLPDLKGGMVQGYDGTTFSLAIDGENLTDGQLLDQVRFTRKTNFFWFAMMQKLLDPGIQYEMLREEQLEGNSYDVVGISYQTENNVASDVYHVYVNRQTGLIDRFLFTVVDKKVVDEPLLMEVKYTEHQGLLFPTYRRYTRSNWQGEVVNGQWVEEISEDLKFDQDIKVGVF